MIGEKVALMKGIAQNKALPAVNGLPTMETTAQGQGTIAGLEGQFFATYSATMQPDGSFFGECPNSGIVMTANGPATFRATGAGTPTAEGGVKFRGACYFQSSAEQLSSLNGKACAYNWDVDAEGNAVWEIWEWV